MLCISLIFQSFYIKCKSHEDMKPHKNCTTKSIITIQLHFLFIFQFIGPMRCVRPHKSVCTHTHTHRKSIFWSLFFLFLFESISRLSVNVLSFRSVSVSTLDCTTHEIINIEYYVMYSVRLLLFDVLWQQFLFGFRFQ